MQARIHALNLHERANLSPEGTGESGISLS